MYGPKKGADPAKGKLDPKFELCFHKNGMVTGFHVEPLGLAGSFMSSWSFPKPSTLVIDGESCAFEYHVFRRQLTLSNCNYKAEWHLYCDVPPSQEWGTICSKKNEGELVMDEYKLVPDPYASNPAFA